MLFAPALSIGALVAYAVSSGGADLPEAAGASPNVQLPGTAAQAPGMGRPLDPTPHVVLDNRFPPAPSMLADDPLAQARFDSQAQPGEYVTPPNVSIAH